MFCCVLSAYWLCFMTWKNHVDDNSDCQEFHVCDAIAICEMPQAFDPGPSPILLKKKPA